MKPGTERGDDQAAARVGGIRLGMAWRAERHRAVEIEVRAPLGAVDDVVDLEVVGSRLATLPSYQRDRRILACRGAGHSRGLHGTAARARWRPNARKPVLAST